MSNLVRLEDCKQRRGAADEPEIIAVTRDLYKTDYVRAGAYALLAFVNAGLWVAAYTAVVWMFWGWG